MEDRVGEIGFRYCVRVGMTGITLRLPLSMQLIILVVKGKGCSMAWICYLFVHIWSSRFDASRQRIAPRGEEHHFPEEGSGFRAKAAGGMKSDRVFSACTCPYSSC
jgi:hypothetical protein